MYRTALLLILGVLAGCATNGERIDRLAHAAGLTRTEVQASGYSSLLYTSGPVAPDGLLRVFLEGDGQPWRYGIDPSPDPTTANPVALKLLMQTLRGGAYVTRPCYHALRAARCTPEKWTTGRYAGDIVASMAAAIQGAARDAAARGIMLIGYSGGGALAILIAERLDEVAAVVSIAANLDTGSWARHHGYLPLSGSLNPAAGERRHPWPELHFQGGRDAVVPATTTEAYFRRHPAARRIVIADFDHECCWVEQWPMLRERLEATLAVTF